MPAMRTLSEALSSNRNKTPPDRSIIARWKHQKLFDKGFVAIPSRFLQLYASLKPFPLSGGEALFVLHLMEFKWDESAPFPGYKTIAARMGVTDKMTRRYAQSLEIKKYLRREKRIGQTNRFDLTPLFDALAKSVDQEKQKVTTKRPSKARKDTLLNWTAKLIDAYKAMSDKDKQELAEWEKKNVDGHSVSTSDWPGWERYIGPRPI